MRAKHYILFYPEKRGERYALRCRVRMQGGKTVTVNMGYTIDPEKWVKDTQRCRISTTHGPQKIPASVINRDISATEERVVRLFTERNGQDIEADDIRRAVYGPASVKDTVARNNDVLLVQDAFDKFMDVVGVQQQWTRATYTKMNAIKRHLSDFDSGLKLSELTEDVMMQFVLFLQKPESKRMRYVNSEQGMRNTTIARTMEFVRYFLRWAHRQGYYDGNLHETFHPKIKGVGAESKTIIYLTWEELMRFYEYRFSDEHLADIRDIFCLSSFTALRYSDVQNLTCADVDIHNKCLTVIQQKTSKKVVINLNKYACAILERRLGERQKSGERVMPKMYSSYANELLKKAAKEVGLDAPVKQVYFIGRDRYENTRPKYEVLTTHCGRRTFVVNALSMGISPYIVKEIGGWANIQAMTPYMALVDEAKKNAMDAFDTYEG